MTEPAGGYKGMLDESDRDDLELIGFLPEKGHESKAIILLKAILKVQTDNASTLSFSNIYDAFVRESAGEATSKAWVHRLLKDLTDSKLVKIEDRSSKRNRYKADINTISSGLSFLREQTINEMGSEIESLKRRKEKLTETDTVSLAQKLVAEWTGKKQQPTSRFLKGLEEFHRVTNETIYHVARKGDVIRTSLARSEPWMVNFPARFKRVFDVAEKGVEVRYAVPPINFDEMEEIFKEGPQLDLLKQTLQSLAGSKGSGPGLHVHVNPAGVKSHQFVSLNDEVLAFWISEFPPTAAWITRDFNADLIDDMIKTFDTQWDESYPIADALRKALKERGAIQPKKG